MVEREEWQLGSERGLIMESTFRARRFSEREKERGIRECIES